MNLNLVLSVIVHTFGRHSRTPRRTALRRLLAANAFATLLGIVITRSLSSLILPNDLFQSWLTIILILVVQIVTAFIMLIVRTSGYGLHDDQMNDVLGILPVSEPARWILGLVPGLCAICMILVLSIGPLVVIAHTMHLAWPLFIVGLGLGLASGIGIGTYQPHRLLAVNFILMIALVAAELQLLDRILTLYQIYENPFLVGFAALISLILVPFYWIIRSMQTWTLSRQRKSATLTLIRGLPIGLVNWMSTKILRHPKTLRSSIVLTGLSGGVAYLWLQSGGKYDPNISSVIVCLSFIASLAASDIRSLTRPHAAPEMIMVRGSRYFVTQQIIIGLLLSLAVTSPLWITILITHSNTLALYSGIVGQLALGTTVALLASTIFVPSQQDISAEFFGAALSTCLILGLEKITASLKIVTSLRVESAIWLGLALGLGMIIFSVEQRRNNYYWKETSRYVS